MMSTKAKATTPSSVGIAGATYANRGGVANAVSVTLAIAYAACVVYYTQPGRSGVLDETWKSDGFCIQGKDVPYWSSFDTCLYVDVIFSALLGALYFKWKDLPGMQTASAMVPYVILGTVAHGAAHGAMAAKFRAEGAAADGEMTPSVDNNRDNHEPEPWKMVLFAAVFWFPLLKASLMSVGSDKVAVLAALVTYAQRWVREVHGFAYVNTMISIAYHGSQLSLDREEKQNRQYLTLPLFAAIPPLITAWNEALFCDVYFKSAGGHMLYDASIIVCFIGYYIDAYYHSAPTVSSKSKKA